MGFIPLDSFNIDKLDLKCQIYHLFTICAHNQHQKGIFNSSSVNYQSRILDTVKLIGNIYFSYQQGGMVSLVEINDIGVKIRIADCAILAYWYVSRMSHLHI
eukprot:NODE_366_length_8705_cov_0.466070.p10 type:complete len:102 gc:universal NODE_366_length_8705_cov_0.466070:364-59(-)